MPDRIVVNSWLLVACFGAVLALSSQSAASIVTYILCLAMLLRIRDWSDVFRCPLIWPVIAVLVYMPLTSLWSEPFGLRDFGSELSRALLIFTFVVAVAECQLRGQVQNWLGLALALIGTLVAVLCIGWFYADPPADNRLNGLGQLDTQVVAAIVFGVTALLVANSLLLSPNNRVRLLGVLCILPLLIAIWLSDSRNAWVAVTLGFIVFWLGHISVQPRRFMMALLILGILAVAGALLVFLQPGLHDMLLPRGDSFRFFIWQETLQRIASNPVFGLGILTSDDIAGKGVVFQHPHSLYLAVAFQGGVVGLLLFLWLLIRTLRELLRRFPHPDARLGLSILAIALPSYLLDGHELIDKVGDTWFLIWLPVGLALGLRWHPAAPR